MKKITNTILVAGLLLTIATAAFAQDQPIPGVDIFRYGPFSRSGLRSIETIECSDVTTTVWIMVPITPVFSIPMPVTTTSQVCEWVCISNC